MRRTRREAGPTPNGGAYSITSWDEDTGNAEIVEHDEQGAILCRHEWRIFGSPPAPDGTVGEVVTFDTEGVESGRRPLKSSHLRRDARQLVLLAIPLSSRVEPWAFKRMRGARKSPWPAARQRSS